MFLVVGLGNPGNKFDQTRHNIGFVAIDNIANQLNVSFNKIGCKAVYGVTSINGEKVILAKPQTYMNLSGESVLEFKNYYKIDLDKIIILYDDIDLSAGEIRIRPKGSAGTHNGMKSIIYQLQSEAFTRVRIGVSPPPQDWDLKDYVLSKFRTDEIDLINSAIKDAAGAVQTIINDGVSSAQQLYNKKPGKKLKQNEDTES